MVICLKFQLLHIEVADHVCDPARFHCACIRKLAYSDAHLRSILSEEPSFYDEFLTREQPVSMIFG